MAVATSLDFVDLVRKSGLLPQDQLNAFLDKNNGNNMKPEELGEALVQSGMMTRFQVEILMQGRPFRFFISGKYKLLDRLGAGGMASVYLCEHRLMRRRVALKVLPTNKANDPGALDRFLREARASATLDHPNIVRAHDVDADGKMHFLVMEYVEGTNLQDLVKNFGPVDVTRTAHYIAQSASALQNAHENGLVHRDIKPSNLLLDRRGMIKVVDMGLALFFRDDEDNLTKEHDSTAVLGTADYLAPEQGIDSHQVDIRADIYSLGMTAYFLLAGKAPFHDGTVAQKLIWHQMRTPKPLNEICPNVPPELAQVIAKMIAKKQEDRYQTPREVVIALAPWTSLPAEPPPSEWMPAPAIPIADGWSAETSLSMSASLITPLELGASQDFASAETPTRSGANTQTPTPQSGLVKDTGPVLQMTEGAILKDLDEEEKKPAAKPTEKKTQPFARPAVKAPEGGSTVTKKAGPTQQPANGEPGSSTVIKKPAARPAGAEASSTAIKKPGAATPDAGSSIMKKGVAPKPAPAAEPGSSIMKKGAAPKQALSDSSTSKKMSPVKPGAEEDDERKGKKKKKKKGDENQSLIIVAIVVIVLAVLGASTFVAYKMMSPDVPPQGTQVAAAPPSPAPSQPSPQPEKKKEEKPKADTKKTDKNKDKSNEKKDAAPGQGGQEPLVSSSRAGTETPGDPTATGGRGIPSNDGPAGAPAAAGNPNVVPPTTPTPTKGKTKGGEPKTPADGKPVQTLTAEYFFPEEEGRVMVYDVAMYPPAIAGNIPLAQRRRVSFKDANNADIAIIKTGSLNSGHLLQGGSPNWRPQPMKEQRFGTIQLRRSENQLEMGTYNSQVRQMIFEPVFKLGAKKGTKWEVPVFALNLKKTYEIVDFKEHMGVPAVVIKSHWSGGPDTTVYMTQTFAQGIGEVERSLTADLKNDKGKILEEWKLVDEK